MRRLDEAGLTTREACGNSVRNVTACELAEVCADAAFDVTPYAEAWSSLSCGTRSRPACRASSRSRSAAAVRTARSARSTTSGSSRKLQDGQRGFKVYAAGGLSTTPQAAITLARLRARGRDRARWRGASCGSSTRHGNRENRSRARMKYVLRKLGEEEFRRSTRSYRAKVDAEAAARASHAGRSSKNAPVPPVDRAATAPRRRGYLAVAQRPTFSTRGRTGTRRSTFASSWGTSRARRCAALAELLRRFGDGTLRLTVDQNLARSLGRQALAAVASRGAARDRPRARRTCTRRATSPRARARSRATWR